MTEQLPLRNESNELRLLFDVSRELGNASDLDGHLEKTLELIASYTGMMRGSLLLIDENTQKISAEASYGMQEGEWRQLRKDVKADVIDRIVELGKPMIVSRTSRSPFIINRTNARDVQKELIDLIFVPLLLGEKTVGIICADSLFAESISLDEDIRLLQILSSLIAQAVQVRREFQSIQAVVESENRRLQNFINYRLCPEGMIGSSMSFRKVLDEVAQVTRSDATVLILGESGTGKELIANTIHFGSKRSGKPFVKVNCAALPENLVESELFGHERGAFTGAIGVHKGRFETAHSGTLFLDEIGDMKPSIQAKLLRVLQEKEFERVGGTSPLHVDVRLVAATNRNLEEMVKDGEFREDLYYRLCVFPITLPPLRERKQDIIPLAHHFIGKICDRHHRKSIFLSISVADLLTGYSWPGNIRELENVLERAVILCGPGEEIKMAHLPSLIRETPADASSSSGSLYEALEELEKQLISEALMAATGNMAKAANRLGISERIIGLRVKKYGLNFKNYR